MLIPSTASQGAFNARTVLKALGGFRPFYDFVRENIGYKPRTKTDDPIKLIQNTIMVLYDPTQEHVANQVFALNAAGIVPYDQIRNIESKVFYPKQPRVGLSGRNYHLLRERAWTMTLADEIEFIEGTPVKLPGDAPREVGVYFFKPRGVISAPKREVDVRSRASLRDTLESRHFYQMHRPLPVAYTR